MMSTRVIKKIRQHLCVDILDTQTRLFWIVKGNISYESKAIYVCMISKIM